MKYRTTPAAPDIIARTMAIIDHFLAPCERNGLVWGQDVGFGSLEQQLWGIGACKLQTW